MLYHHLSNYFLNLVSSDAEGICDNHVKITSMKKGIQGFLAELTAIWDVEIRQLRRPIIYLSLYICVCVCVNKNKYNKSMSNLQTNRYSSLESRVPKCKLTYMRQAVNPRNQTQQGISVAKPTSSLSNHF